MAKKKNIHTISIFVANKPGVLVRVAQVFARRAYNIDSLVVSPAVNERFSRMTITAQGDPETLEQIIKQCSKLIDVIHASEHTGEDSIDREFSLYKLKVKNRTQIVKLIKNKAHIVDEDDAAVIVGQSGTTVELDDLEEKLKGCGIIEMVRSGKLVMAKGQEET